MNKQLAATILEATGADGWEVVEVIQELWSGYGEIVRIRLTGSPMDTVVVKHVRTSSTGQHPRGWDSDIGHRRKVRSYLLESIWYQEYGPRSLARMPQCLAVDSYHGEVLVVLEDLDAAGFHLRKQSVTWQEVDSCLRWLARFHADFVGCKPEGL